MQLQPTAAIRSTSVEVVLLLQCCKGGGSEAAAAQAAAAAAADEYASCAPIPPSSRSVAASVAAFELLNTDSSCSAATASFVAAFKMEAETEGSPAVATGSVTPAISAPPPFSAGAVAAVAAVGAWGIQSKACL